MTHDKTTGSGWEKWFLETIVEETGADLPTWMERVAALGETRHAEIHAKLREGGLNYAQANILALIFKNGGKPVYQDADAAMDALLAGKEAMRPVGDAVRDAVLRAVPEAEVVATKGYVSFRAPREFATATIRKDEVRVGFCFPKGAPEHALLQPAKTLGTMPTITVMAVARRAEDVTLEMGELLRQAHAARHTK